MVTHTDTNFLQIFLWGRFRTLAPKPVEFSAMELIETVFNGVKKYKQSAPDKTRLDMDKGEAGK